MQSRSKESFMKLELNYKILEVKMESLSLNNHNVTNFKGLKAISPN